MCELRKIGEAEQLARQTVWSLLFAGFWTAIRDALLLLVVVGLLAILINAFLHPRGIPLVAQEEYETVVPCPVPGGQVTALAVGDPVVQQTTTMLIDARKASEYQKWHLPRARNVTFDYLEPVDKKVLRALLKDITERQARKVVVYGDGENPDSGEQLGRELSGNGIKNVYFIKGGLPALVRAERKGGRPTAGEEVQSQVDGGGR